jgi:hypothetical protein
MASNEASNENGAAVPEDHRNTPDKVRDEVRSADSAGRVKILRMTLLNVQVCVPKGIPIEEVLALVEAGRPCGTTNGWAFSERHGRVECAGNPEREHLVLDA